MGRHAERARLDEAFAGARAGRGGVVFVAGESGVGKTALAESALAASGFVVLAGRSREEATPSFGPVAAALRTLGERSPAGTSDFGPLASHLAALLPELGPVPDGTEPEILREAINTAFLSAARREPTALFLDDLQWADNATLETLPHLADRIRGHPLLVLATYRSDELARNHPLRRTRSELRRSRLLTEITLDPLDEEETGAILSRCLGGRPSEELIRTVYDKTQGVPLYVEELAAALISGGRLQAQDGILRLLPGEDVPIPESIRDAVLLRLDPLPEAVRNQLEVAAIAGMEFDLDLVARLADGDEDLDALLETRLVSETAPGAGAFRHALVRDAIRSEITWSRRRSLHRRIATYLERQGTAPELVAEHWLAAKESGPARRALLDVAERACRVHAYLDAARAGNRALEIWPEGQEEGERIAALYRLAHCSQIGGQLGDAIRALREILDSPVTRGDARRRAEAHRALATAQGLSGSWELALDNRIEAARAFEDSGALEEAAVERLAVSGRLTAQHALDRALEAAQQAGGLASRAENVDLIVRAKGAEGNLLAMLGQAREGRALAEEALSLALETNSKEAAAEAYRRLASVLDYSSDFAGSRDAYATAVEHCQSFGDDANARVCLGCMSAVVFRTGEWKRALEVCQRVLQDPGSPPGSLAIAHGILGMIRAVRGEVRGAKSALRECTTLAQLAQFAMMELYGRHGLALLAELDEDVEQATGLHRQVRSGWRRTQDRHDLVPVFLWQATFFGRHGLEVDANECASALAHMAGGFANPETDAALAHALAELALLAGKPAEAARQFEHALSLTERLEIPLEHAVTSWRAGVAHAEGGDREEAVRRLTHGYRTARNLGARPLAGWIRIDLEALGEQVEEGRAPADGDRAGLTRRQVEIVRLLAEGLTNKEIAQRLYLSSRTIDMHVSHALDRLDCRSRTEAARRAAELGLLD